MQTSREHRGDGGRPEVHRLLGCGRDKDRPSDGEVDEQLSTPEEDIKGSCEHPNIYCSELVDYSLCA